MTTHISARLAWHDSGWNGSVCRNPHANTFCVGQYSFPGDTIARHRDLKWEGADGVKGQPICKLNNIPPCIMSVNAFGSDELQASNAPPTWFDDTTATKNWLLPPYTVTTWPYEEMYRDEVVNPKGAQPPHYNPEKRREFMRSYFSAISPDRSLIFYYANYSNPFSENEQMRYVVVGASRIKSVGEELTWTRQSDKTLKRYGPMVWFRNVTSHYPEQGLRIPYHSYLDRPDVLERILLFPDNPRHFKYATRHISDDGALGLIERLREIVGVLQEIGDKSENWALRQEWLTSVMAELWHSRGLYPGLARVWDYLKFTDAVPFTMAQVAKQGEQTIKDRLFALVEGRTDNVPGLDLSARQISAVRKKWGEIEKDQQPLLRDTLPRFDLQKEQIARLIDEPQKASIYASPAEIHANPYVLCEQHVGANPDDRISFSQIDHGLFPSPDLGAASEFERDGWERMRALCVEQLHATGQHTFELAQNVLDGLNRRLAFLPEWKRNSYKPKQFETEKDNMAGALTYRYEGDQLYLYLKSVFDDERYVESTLRQLAARSDVRLRSAVLESDWTQYLTDSNSPFYKTYPDKYAKAISQQVVVCQKIFPRSLSVLCGAAGTGKTTVVKAIINAIEKGHGVATPFQLLAPTGKAADRLRERTGKPASTIHSFLAKHGWVNDNFTFKPSGGKREEGITTYIVDESSMLDLPLLATLFRAINWNSVQRFIFVGDPNQLPPIGTGKVFADLIDWLKGEAPGNIGELTTNMRNILNEIEGKGTGIIDLASLFVRRELVTEKSMDLDAQEEALLQEVQGEGIVRGDLRMLYWKTPEELEKRLLETIQDDMTDYVKRHGQAVDPGRPDQLWQGYWQNPDKTNQPERNQVISPYRGELFGVEHINTALQLHKNRWWLENKGSVGGITYADKVIQIINRPESNSIWAYDIEQKKNSKIQVYNGEIGLTKIHGFDTDKWRWKGFHVDRFQVVFSRKPKLWVGYGSESEVAENLELAYAISVHKAQGSEFEYLYFILPKYKRGLLSRELFYTGITRAQTFCTLFVQEDMSPILSLRRPENSYLARINSSLFRFRPISPDLQKMNDWYVEGRIHRTLTDEMVRSKSEVIIANILFDREIPFEYEVPLQSPIDGTIYLPDFTINLHGEPWYWEHLGLLHDPKYKSHWEVKVKWYEKNGFWDHVIVSEEGPGFDSKVVEALIRDRLGVWGSSIQLEPQPSDAEHLAALVAQGEGTSLEFKETLEADSGTGKSLPSLIQSSLKTIAAYLNTNGGILLIGVANDGAIKGLEKDYPLCKYPNDDGFEQKLRDLIRGRFDPAPLGQVRIDFVAMLGGTVCQVEVSPSDEVVHYDKFVYIRDGNGTIKLEGRDLTDWLFKRARK